MITSKFKVGDKIRCVKPSAAVGVHVGKVYTVKGYDGHCRGFGCVLLIEVNSSPYEASFELVQEDAVLTPEEVFEHLRKGTKLQYRRDYRDISSASCIGWRDCSNPQFANISNRMWRIKPEPEIITLNGKRYQALED